MALVFTPAFEGLTFKSADVVAPEFGLVGETGVLSIKIEMHLAYSTICHTVKKKEYFSNNNMI